MAIVKLVHLQCLPLSLQKPLKSPRTPSILRRRLRPTSSLQGDSEAITSLTEQTIDFAEIEYIEVEDKNAFSAFSSMDGEVALDPDALSFTTVEEGQVQTDQAGTFNSIWLLTLCTVSYLHCCSTGFAIPALVPSIASDTTLTDSQGAFLTVGFTIVFALGQIPFGYLADRSNRPKLLSIGIIVWSVVTSLAAKAHSFSDLMIIRFITAAAQAMQNPICFGLIPELFPKRKTTALSLYNCALYIGRALTFLFALIIVKFGMSGAGKIETVPLEQFDVGTMSLLYITGNQATVAPLFDYDFGVIAKSASSWRDLLFWIGLPGISISCLLAWIPDPRGSSQTAKTTSTKGTISELLDTVGAITKSRGFQFTTLAAAMNDIGFWSLISWQALFYERVYQISSSVYAPVLATIIPVSGIIGGVGGSLIADWLNKRNARFLLTFGATFLGSPLIFMSFQSGDYKSSFVYLLFGYIFLEAYRASASIMVRESSPPGAASSGAAVHLLVRNLFAGIGPILIAFLEPKVGLRNSMMIVPLSYLLSAISFGIAEKILVDQEVDAQLQT